MPTNKLNIALIGYGKMGKIIDSIARKRGHKVALKISSSNLNAFNADNLKDIDVAIEFSKPKVALQNLKTLANNKIPTACGTTGWHDHYQEVCKSYLDNKAGFIYASNFSLGVNVFFALNQHLAKLMNGFTAYDIAITEAHHITKKDAPSGTAITLAEDLIKKVDRKSSWTLDRQSEEEIGIKAIREQDIKGTHTIAYRSEIDEISIRHKAFSREGFALGAVLAAEFIHDKSDIHTMQDVLKLSLPE